MLASANVVLTASGTATVQAALHDTPMVIVYRMSPLSYRLVRRLVTVDKIGMVNLIAGEKIVPELIQDAFTPATVAGEAISMLTDELRVERIRAGLAKVREKLGGPGASRRAAEAILRVVVRAKPEPHPSPSPSPCGIVFFSEGGDMSTVNSFNSRTILARQRHRPEHRIYSLRVLEAAGFRNRACRTRSRSCSRTCGRRTAVVKRADISAGAVG